MMSTLIVLALLSRISLAIPELSQVFVISRHGSRSELRKSADYRHETGEVLLTPLGEKQVFDLGVWLRQRYGPSGLNLLDNYDVDQVRFESSDVERTVSSAHALSLGLFPPSSRKTTDSLLPDGFYQSIPVYMEEKRNDVHIRAYEKCPTFFHYLEVLYNSSNWTQIENDNKEFLANLTNIEAFKEYANDEGFIPLSEIWNVYDTANVAKVECAANPNLELCDAPESLSTQPKTWNALESLAHYAELARYSRDTAGDMLAGNLLLKMHAQMGGQPIGENPAPETVFVNRKFYHYSAHYPTILSIFATLNLKPPSLEVIPKYAAAIIFELYKDAAIGEDLVFMLYKEGGEAQEVSVRLPGPCKSSFACPLTDFTEILRDGLRYSSPAEWCAVCGNTAADVCLEQQIALSTPSGSLTDVTPTAAPQPTPVMMPPSVDPAATPLPVELPPTTNTDPPPTPVSDLNPDAPKGTITCPTNHSESASAGVIAGAFAGGVGLGILILVAIQYLISLRTGVDKKDVDVENPDNIIDLDLSGCHA